MKLKTFSKALIATSIAVTVQAETPDAEVYLGIDFTKWNSNLELEENMGLDGGVSVPVNEEWSFEGWFSRSETESSVNSEDVTVQTISLNALNYLDEGTLRPFYTFGLSHNDLDPENGDSDSYPSLDFGIGAKKYFENNIILRGDMIGRFSNEDGDLELDPVLRLTIGYAFGGSTKSKAPEITKTPTKIESKPVEVDSDGDGVLDSIDKCADTKTGLKVDEFGCRVLLTETVSIDLNVNFANNSDVVEASYFSEIQKVAAFMEQYDGTIVEIRGYTDDRGKAEYNKDLSDRRAKAVAEVLASEFSIATNRITANGYGEENPIADNSTSEGRAKNRRVVAEISTEISKEVTK